MEQPNLIENDRKKMKTCGALLVIFLGGMAVFVLIMLTIEALFPGALEDPDIKETVTERVDEKADPSPSKETERTVEAAEPECTENQVLVNGECEWDGHGIYIRDEGEECPENMESEPGSVMCGFRGVVECDWDYACLFAKYRGVAKCETAVENLAGSRYQWVSSGGRFSAPTTGDARILQVEGDRIMFRDEGGDYRRYRYICNLDLFTGKARATAMPWGGG